MTKPALQVPPPAWIAEPATAALLRAFAEGGATVRFVGGAVRDALLGLTGSRTDIDLATPAAPERVIALLGRAGIKTVPTGLAHGTVTAILGSGPGMPPRHFEITTLRRDVETYGRRARVAFDADWAADARRRDFTINAIYLDPDGTVHDPVGGLADLEARRVRFVGDPALRIAEDVLRILRYYRFEARFGTGEGNPPARAACHAAADLLPTLSPERVTQELVKLLDGASPVAALRMMAQDGVLAVVLPEARRIDRLAQLIALDPEPDPLLRLSALIEADADAAAALARRLRLPNAWRERLAGLAPPWPLEPGADWPAQRHALYRLGAARYREVALLSAAAGATTAARLAELLDVASRSPAPVFPLTGRDVTALGVPPGERVGRLLGELRRWWEESDFAADRTQCLAWLKQLAMSEEDRS
ncbi:MAG: CCA tRNA nucleotidyltransferase [Stellaceae bacterium]